MYLQTALTRRGWMTRTAASLTASSWLGAVAAASEEASRSQRSCLMLWMNGGPAQTDSFDLKPEHENGGPFQPIDTNVPGIQISEHLPNISQWMHRLSIVRSMSTREGDHGRARDHLRTGYLPQGSIQFPVLGSLVSHEWEGRTVELPNYVSILPRGLFRPGVPPAGFLGPGHAPLIIGGSSGDGETTLRVENLALPKSVSLDQMNARLELRRRLEQEFLSQHPGTAADAHLSASQRSIQLMSPTASAAFDLSAETPETHAKYGATQFGQGCLLARRMLERGVPFVEVTLGGWDTHYDNFTAVQNLSTTLDQAWSALLRELEERGLLETTLVVWMGEFGRTPVINPQVGRDHYPKAWSAVLGGGGIRGGQIIGRTSVDGLSVEDHAVSTPDLLATICLAMGLDPRKQNISNVARPIRLVDPGFQAIEELLV